MTAHLTIKLDDAAASAIDKLAVQYGEPVDVLVNEALTAWLDVQAGHLSAIKAGLAQLDRGETVTQAEMEELAASYTAAP